MKPPKKTAVSPSFKKGIIAGLIVIIGAGLAAWWIGHSGTNTPAKDKGAGAKKGMIAEVTPQIAPATNKVEETAPKQLPLAMKRDHSELSREDLLTKVPPWAYSVTDRMRVDPGYAKRRARFLQRQENNPWKTYADNALAALIFNDGNRINLPPFNPKFKDAFLKSLETPIIPSHDDPPELQERKRQMNETKIWLKGQLDEGKDIVEILNEEYDRQKRIVGLRDSLRSELFELEKTAKSTQEIEEYVATANKMLEEAGDTRNLSFPTYMTTIRLEREAVQKEDR